MGNEKPVTLKVKALVDRPGMFVVWGCHDCAEMMAGLTKDTTYALTVRDGVNPAHVCKSVGTCTLIELVPPAGATAEKPDKESQGK